MSHLQPHRLERLEAYEPEDEPDAMDDHAVNCEREAAITMLAIMRAALDYMQSAKTKGEQAMRVDIACWYFCHPNLAALNLTEIGVRHGKHRATASAQLALFERSVGMPPQIGQKLKQARKIYQDRAKENRKEQIK